jgi:hypothetical protein
MGNTNENSSNRNRYILVNKDYEYNLPLKIGYLVRSYRTSNDILNTLNKYFTINDSIYDYLNFPYNLINELFRKKSERRLDIDDEECEFYQIIENKALDEFEAADALCRIDINS